jgi:alkylhydroperoxidase family enzyme
MVQSIRGFLALPAMPLKDHFRQHETKERVMSRSHRPLPEVVPEAYRTVSAVEAYIRGCGLEKSLVELVKPRASQINGCAFCIDMHSKDARIC